MTTSKPFVIDNMIKPGDFVEVGEDTKSDFDPGTLMWVINMQAFPISEEDIYLQRLYAICHTVNPDFTMDTTTGVVLDPQHLVLLDEEKQERYYNLMNVHYLPQPEQEVVN